MLATLSHAAAAASLVYSGMNKFELSKNAQLDDYAVQDLNVDPKFPYADNSFDVVTCVVRYRVLVLCHDCCTRS